jgi:hypothetical protein
MATDHIKKNGQSNLYKSDAGGATLIREPVIGIVKNNIDPTRSGKIDIYVDKGGGADANDSNNWIKGVRYLSPFYGITGAGPNPLNGQEKTGDGKFVGNPQSYGFWASAPDIGTEVVCIFIGGLANQAYYIGCVPKPGLLQMTPAMGASDNVVPNESEGASYGGADRLPTSEVNYSNPSVKNSPQVYNEAKPIHSYQASILSAQGLIRDNVRGVISSSAQRETPSRVFGISTPGGPIFEGGYTSATIADAAKTADAAKLKQIGRTGGHTFVMDDGTLTGQDQLIRLRSSAGHQITMSDSGQTLFIIHSNGQSWIEMGREGTIDIYSTNSFNVRTQGDINFHADRNINLNAAKNLNLFGENINIESSKDYTQRVGVNYSNYTMGKYTVKVDGAMSQQSSGQASYSSSAETFINGSKVNLNSGTAGLTPALVSPIQKTNHIDTTNSGTVGWMSPSPEPLVSITNRAPAHQPWIGSDKGVDVKISSSPVSEAQQTTPAAAAVNASTPAAPSSPVTPAAIAAAPAVTAPTTGPITPATAQAMVAQVATTAQSAGDAVNKANGVLASASGVTAAMAEAAGAIKPGAATQATELLAKGMDTAKSLAGAVTGAVGATSPTALIKDVTTQANVVAVNIDKAAASLTSAGVLTGYESAAQAAGLVMGAVTKGAGAVVDLVKTGVTKVEGLVNDIAGGKFAAGLADSLSFKGLKTSLSGLADGIKGKISALGDSIGDIASNLKSGLQNAFAAVEKSFGTLKAGVANVLGPKTAGPAPTQQPSDVAKAGDAYAVAEAEISSAEDAYFAAKRDYRNESTPANNEALQKAEAALSAARQKKAQASTAFLKSSVGGASATASLPGSITGIAGGIAGAANNIAGGIAGAANNIAGIAGGVAGGVASAAGAITDAATSAVAGVKNTLNTGLNSLPGGPAVLQSVVNNSPVGTVISQGSTALGAVDSALSSVGGLAANKDKLAGDLVGKTKGLVTDAMSKIGDLGGDPLSKIKSGAAGIMGQLEASFAGVSTGAGAIKAAEAAVGTFDNSALIAKTGQLLGNPKIPMPSFGSGSALPPPNANKQSAEVTAAYEAVKDAGYRVNSAKLNLSLTKKSGNEEKVAEATEGLKKEEVALKTAQDAYTSLVA